MPRLQVLANADVNVVDDSLVVMFIVTNLEVRRFDRLSVPVKCFYVCEGVFYDICDASYHINAYPLHL